MCMVHAHAKNGIDLVDAAVINAIENHLKFHESSFSPRDVPGCPSSRMLLILENKALGTYTKLESGPIQQDSDFYFC